MAELRRYRRKPGTAVIAVQLDLDTEGFSYRKWGATQQCKAKDWIVNNAGDTYSVDAATFAKTYREQSPGRYVKAGHVFAERAAAAGSIKTKEGQTAYHAGDMLVFNEPNRGDGYAVSAEKFDQLYEADPDDA